MQKRTLNLIKVAVGLLLLVFIGPLVYIILMTFVFDTRRPVQYLIPNGYVGWARIEYEIKEASPLPRQRGYWIAKIPSTGVLRTSSIQGDGWAADEHYYITDTEARRRLDEVTTGVKMIHPLHSGGKSEELFIGTKAQLQKIGWSYAGRPGPIKAP